jgi:CRISPR-associated protein Cas5h
MKLLVFDLKGDIGHFRRPDTTATHASYPFITRTALRGLLGSILGLERWTGEAWTGLQLLHPVNTKTQQLSLLGKGYFSSGTFNRPTSIELVIKPHYRIYFHGDHFGVLQEYLTQGLSVYHTYLGSAFALTKPQFIKMIEVEEAIPKNVVNCLTVVPSHLITKIEIQPGHQYVRAGGIPYESLGEQRYEGTMNFIYERSGQPLRFAPIQGQGVSTRWVNSEQGWISLW